ncbi:MAG: tetratricopeptide repeat protein [Saprospiraceae bacterium]|nr:tetratricopeptide repeat protein [Saprospiraceae bacterium]MCB9318719.1 tetratricopeptide repeat protein [Lewinellaceae bacterium]
MAKIINYQPNQWPGRKVGFRKANKTKAEQQEAEGQLNLFQATDPDEAIETPQVSKLRKLTSHRTPFEEALFLDEMGDPRAEARYLDAIAANSSSADAICNMGIIYAGKGETAKAIGAFTKALSLQPRHLEAHYNLANVYFDASNYDLAIVHYEVALEIDPDFGDAWFNLTIAFLATKMHKKAMDAYLQYRRLVPADQEDLLSGYLKQ